MPQRRLYDSTTVPFAFRMSPDSRALLDYLATCEGMTAGHYMRRLWERHLRAEGYVLTPGAEAVSDPEWGTPDGWVRDRTERGERVEATHEDPG